MFVSFNKVFNKKPQAETEVPQAMLEYMSKQLPEGVKYISDKDGRCTIISEKESLTIGGMEFRPSEAQKKILGPNFTHEDVLSYFYNAQRPMPLVLKKDGYITINGKEIPIEAMSCNPMLPVKYVSGSFYAYPSKFPDPIQLNVGDGKYSRNLTISRVPNESVNIATFHSKKDEPLSISYSIDEKQMKLTMSISFNLKYAKTIRDVVESTMIYNAYAEGRAYLGTQPIETVAQRDNDKGKFNLQSAAFWEKVLQIETCLGLNFIPPLEDVQNEDIILVEELYQNLINRTPIRDVQKLTSINGNWDLNDSNRNIQDAIGKNLFFQFESIVDIELFGEKFSLPMLTAVFNVRLKEIGDKDGTPKLILEDESKEKTQYVCTMLFKTSEELEDYKSKEINTMIEVFSTAKFAREYL